MSETRSARRLDLTGQICPWPVVFTMKEVKKMVNGDVLEVLVDHIPSTKNIPEAVKKEGHEVLDSSRMDDGVYKIVVKINK
ncbi:MAG: sulfurtransferase TusA family protein [Thaumarchaeota archaeon]|nr:sulfurtransferase TusA family protein [Nitrososphaerota archaeon]